MKPGIKTALAALAVSAAALRAEAAVVITVDEIDGGVTFSYSGAIDTSMLGAPVTSQTASSGVFPADGAIGLLSGTPWAWGVPSLAFEPYGAGDYTLFTSAPEGDPFGIVTSFNLLLLPQNYVSGAPISGSLFEENTSISKLGMIAGVYEGAIPGDKITLRINGSEAEVSAVPLPATLPLMIAGLGGLAVFRSRKS